MEKPSSKSVVLDADCNRLQKRFRGPRPICRRLFLRGAGGVVLGLPFLPSLHTKKAFAQDPSFTVPPNFWYLGNGHGGFADKLFPADSALTQTGEFRAGHTFRWGTLAARREGNDNVLTPILRAPANVFTDALVGKMNIINGLDIPMRIEHHTGGHLGNYDAMNRAGGDPRVDPRPTIDQFLGYTPSFYRDLTGVRQRVMLVGSNQGISWGYSNPTAMSGTVQRITPSQSSRELFNQIFVPSSQPGPQPMARRPIIDRVMDSYRRLRDGNRRISVDDKQRLDDHLSQLSELERRLSVTQSSAAACAGIQATTENSNWYDPMNATSLERHARLYNDVVVAAFACGSSRIGVFNHNYEPLGASYSGGSWHQDVAHQWGTASSQTHLTNAYRFTFEKILLDLARKLENIQIAPGKTLLDTSLLAWSMESGDATHRPISIPIVSFGGARGFFQTGRAVDYRNRVTSARVGSGAEQTYLGALRNQWFANVLLAMGVPATEFERWGHKGYGTPTFEPAGGYTVFRQYHQSLTGPYFQMASQPLPAIT